MDIFYISIIFVIIVFIASIFGGFWLLNKAKINKTLTKEDILKELKEPNNFEDFISDLNIKKMDQGIKLLKFVIFTLPLTILYLIYIALQFNIEEFQFYLFLISIVLASCLFPLITLVIFWKVMKNKIIELARKEKHLNSCNLT